MGVWSALTGAGNAHTQAASAARRAANIQLGKAAKAAGRGSRQVRGAVPAKKKRGW